MQILKVLLSNIECIADSSVQEKIKGIYQSAKLGKMLTEAFIFGDNVGKDVEKSKPRISMRSIALQLIEEIIFLAEIDDNHTSADGIEINDIDEDLIFGSANDFEFDNEESSGNGDPSNVKHSPS